MDAYAELGFLLGWLSYDLMGFIGLIILGLVIILVVRLLIAFVPAIAAALVVWFFTGNTWWTGLAFLIVAILSILKKLR